MKRVLFLREKNRSVTQAAFRLLFIQQREFTNICLAQLLNDGINLLDITVLSNNRIFSVAKLLKITTMNHKLGLMALLVN